MFYFLIASIIYFYQKRNDKNITKKFLEIIKNQSKFIYLILLIFNNFLLFRFYQILKNKKDKEENNRKNLKIENFFLLSINYFFVLPGIPIIILCLYISENYNLISDILLMSSITIFITSSISFYARPFVLISNRFKDALRFLKIKKILIFPILIILFLAKHLLVLEGFIVINISIFFLLYLWRNEANMAILEFESSKNKLFYNLLEVVSIKSLLIINIFFQNFTLEIITLIILIVLLVYRNTEIYKIKDINQTFGYFKKFVDQNLFYVFLNSFILNLTNFFHRYLILIFADKTYAGILFFAFSMGSFPANLFSFVLSSTIIRSKNPLPTFGIISFFIYFILSIYFICLNIFNVDSSIIYYIFEKQHLEFIFYSMLGGMLMSYALFQKNKILLIKNSMKKIFIPEFIYSLIILALIPYIYYYFSVENFKFIFLLNSIFAFIIFIPMHKFLKNE